MATQIAPTDERTNAQLPALTPEGERFALRQRQARMFAMSPLVPDHLRKGSQEQAIANCWIALTLAEAMGEVPLIVMQNIHVVNGKAGFASQYMIARANSSGVFKGRIDWRIDRTDPNNLTVTAYAYLRETGQEVSVTCDMRMAQAEQWTKNPKYKTMPEVMLRYRSAAFLVRFYAPDVMLGYQTSEEIEDVAAAVLPTAPALNASMLIEQSLPQADEPSAGDRTDHQEETQEASGTAREAPGAEESTSASSATGGASTDGPAPEGENGDPVQGHLGEPLTEQEDRDHNGGYTIAEERAQEAAEASEHAGAAKADEIIAEIKGANAIIDVNSIVARYRTDIEAMPDELGAKVEIAADKRKAEINTARETAGAK